MGTMASQITSLAIVYSTGNSCANQRKHQSSASLGFVREIHRWPVNSPIRWPVTRKIFPFDDVIMMMQGVGTLMVNLCRQCLWYRSSCHRVLCPFHGCICCILHQSIQKTLLEVEVNTEGSDGSIWVPGYRSVQGKIRVSLEHENLSV